MSQCKKCGAEIVWEQTETGKYKPPMNPDGSFHKCEGQQEQLEVIGDPNYQSNPQLVPQAEKRVREIVHEETRPLPLDIVAPLDVDKLAETFKKFEDFKNRLLTTEDSVQIQNKRFLKKSAWRKWALACGVSDELVSTERVPKEGYDAKDGFYYRTVVKAEHKPTGRTSIGVAVASKNEKSKWAHEEHDVFSLSHTRAKSRAIADLVGGGEVSAEEMNGE